LGGSLQNRGKAGERGGEILTSVFNDSEGSIKRQVSQLEAENQPLVRENELLSSRLADSEATVHNLMKELSDLVGLSRAKDEEIGRLKQTIEEEKRRNTEQEKLLAKMTQSYEDQLDEVSALQEKLDFQQLGSSEEIGSGEKAGGSATTKEPRELEHRDLEDRCLGLEDELRTKKNTLAEIVNIIWRYGDPELMRSIETFME
jgi:predicted transcriptional regulator